MNQGNFKLIGVICLLFLVIGLMGLILQPKIDPETPSMPIIVMTYNIHQAFDNYGVLDLDKIRDTIKDSGASIVGLEESDTARISSGNLDAVKYLSEELNMYSFYGPATSEHTYGVSLLSKLPINNTEVHFLTSEEDQRVCIEAQIEINSTTALTVFVVHQGLSWKDRMTQVDEIIQLVNDTSGPKILMGDFNSKPDGTPEPESGETRNDTVYAEITQILKDSWTEVGYEIDSPDGYTWEAKELDRRIDYIFVSTDITVTACRVIDPDKAPGSDHLPLIATIFF